MALSLFPQTRNNSGGRFGSSSPTCPYCSKTFTAPLARDRHIILKQYCREWHLYSLSHPTPKRRKNKRKRQETNLPLPSEPPSKQLRAHDGAPPPSEPETPAPPANDAEEPGERTAAAEGDERICTEPFVEHFPISAAGTPISNDWRETPNLREYVESCGTLADPELFDTAELLMMTVLKSSDRTRHLKRPAVSFSTLLKDGKCSPSKPVSIRGKCLGRTTMRW
jgi:hypothetical protein